MKIHFFDFQGVLWSVGKRSFFLQGVNGKFRDTQPRWKIFENVDKLYMYIHIRPISPERETIWSS